MWNMKEEEFLKDVDLLRCLKLKGRVGCRGKCEIGNYDDLGVVGSGNYNREGGWYICGGGNEELGWEREILSKIGIEG